MKIVRYVIFTISGYVIAIGLLLAGFAIFDISGWYVFYIPVFAIFGSIIALFFVNYRINDADQKTET